jgi:hypothetical protein
MKRYLEDEIIQDGIEGISPVKLIVKPYRKACTRLRDKDEKFTQLAPIFNENKGLQASSQVKPVRIKRESLKNQAIETLMVSSLDFSKIQSKSALEENNTLFPKKLIKAEN